MWLKFFHALSLHKEKKITRKLIETSEAPQTLFDHVIKQKRVHHK